MTYEDELDHDDEGEPERRVVSAPMPPRHGHQSPPAEPKWLKHMAKTPEGEPGSYFYKGKKWSAQTGIVQSTEGLSQKDVEYLLKLVYTIPAQDPTKRREVKRFKLLHTSPSERGDKVAEKKPAGRRAEANQGA